jgi:hypothetical protein
MSVRVGGAGGCDAAGLDTGTSSVDTGASFDGVACRLCIIEENAPGGQCESAFEACAADPECVQLLDCIEVCVGGGSQSCIVDCCTTSAGGAFENTAVGSCNAIACGATCDGVALSCPS